MAKTRCQLTLTLGLLLFSSFYPVLSVSSCPAGLPTSCKCTDRSVICRDGYKLNAARLQNLPESVTRLTIENYDIETLTVDYFTHLPNLKDLSIVDCKVSELVVGVLDNLKDLQSLNLAFNHIHELPADIVQYQTKLESLNLTHNAINTLTSESFTAASHSLRSLILRENHIQLLPATVFDNMTKLEHLDLSGNRLAYVLPRTFSHIAHIRYIDLRDNLIVTLNPDLFFTNNETILTSLSISKNPLTCNCGLEWLSQTISNDSNAIIKVLDGDEVVCDSPAAFHGQNLTNVLPANLKCQQPSTDITVLEPDSQKFFHANKMLLRCDYSGDPAPSIVWVTPLGDELTDSERGEWLEYDTHELFSEKRYQIYATGEKIIFNIRSGDGYSILSVDGLHLVSTGQYLCKAYNPAGNSSSEANIFLNSAILDDYFNSLLVAICTAISFIAFGAIGCFITTCLDKCSCCSNMKPAIKYYDGHLIQTLPQPSTTVIIEDSDSDSADNEGTAASSLTAEINSHDSNFTAEEWDEYFREYPDDFIVEACDNTPGRYGSPTGRDSPRGSSSPSHRPQGRTIETLEGVRLRLKLRVEQIDVMRERLRIRVGKRSARMKETIDKRRERMNKKMQNIKESTSQSLQTIKEHGRNYSHKLHKGVLNAMENVGYQVKSLKELCGTGDIGQTLSVATIVTDVDTNETHELIRSVTMV